MTLSSERTQRIVSELQPILGARIQRIDVVDVREIVLELRCPGRTLRLLVSARPGFGRLHLVDRRPSRLVPGGSLQALLRKRLTGRPLSRLDAVGAGVELHVPGSKLALRFNARKDALEFESSEVVETLGETREIPEHFPENEAVAAEYGTRDEVSRESRLRAAILQPLRARQKKLQRLELRVHEDRAKLERLLPGRHQAELLKTALGRAQRGATSVEVHDWALGEDVTLSLDPSLPPKLQMERWFQRAKKAERGLPRVEARLLEVGAELARVQTQIEEVEQETAEALEERIREPGLAVALQERKAPKQGPSAPIDRWSRAFRTVDGCEVRVGKGAAENDRLTFAVAKGTDVWLHARGVPGSHVLLRRGKGEPILQEALLDAAHLAVHYSDARSEAKAEVVYTEARNVKKLKGAAPGLVSVSKEKTLWLEVEPKRLERLLQRETK